ncbi:methyltransferase [Frigoribacterium sp. CG_9.8]|uniref:methyltransferase n=1 Tax=Frigoribacterium sp. CG_9.8 TaxID=2787733 RepID=UPI0018CBBA46|nr:SAM-dependent methyltransferase [Frigoribacterium sp. CG_9.8]
MNSTPLRDLSVRRTAEASVLNGAVLTGAPLTAHEAAILASSSNVPSWDPSLVGDAETVGELFHVDPARSNILRSLDIHPNSVVLEVGAGAGALSRYLAESVSILDTLEPRLALASTAAVRLAGFKNARVFAGDLSDVPPVPAYDLIVAVDQLRVAAGAADLWLAQAAALLSPGGSIVIAETNRLGAKFLVGSPDDGSNIVFDSIEGYPRGSSDRAHSRSELTDLVIGAGLEPHVLVALPDHRIARVVADPSRLSGEHARLLSDLAFTPSPDYGAQRPKLADESRVWEQLVEEGLGGELANSFVILAAANASQQLWSPDNLAIYFSWQRAAEFTSQTIVHRSGEKVIFTRHYPRADPSTALSVHDSSYEFVVGSTLASVIAGAPDDRVAAWLAGWRELLIDFSAKGHLWLDLHPGNLIIGPDGALVPIDLEFETVSHDVDFAIRRGLITISRLLALTTHPSLWPDGVRSVRDIGTHLGKLMGYSSETGWFNATIIDEAEFQRTVAGSRGSGRPRSAWIDELTAVADTPLRNLPLGDRVFENVEMTVSERDSAYARLGVFDARIRELESEVQALSIELTERTTKIRVLEVAFEERDFKIRELEHDLVISRSTLSRHIASLEIRSQLERGSSSELEKALRNEIHDAHLAAVKLRSSRTFQLATRLQAAVAVALPIGSIRRRLAVRLARAVQNIARKTRRT